MKVFYPLYYKDFRCIAEKCTHSCCVGWEISVDSDTMEKYKNSGREDILCHIEDEVICLSEGDRCPFLRADGLCRIIAELGDEYTSLICREHPRFYHKTGDRVEGGIGLSCEEAARLILSSDNYDVFCEIEHTPDIAEETDFDSLSHREEIYRVLKSEAMDFAEKLGLIKAKYSLEIDIHTPEEWAEILTQLEYLDEGHRGIFSPGKGRGEYGEIYERFLAYLIFRHLSTSENYDNLRARLGFCLLMCSLLEGYTAEGGRSFAEICEFARVISEELEYSEDNTAEIIFEFEATGNTFNGDNAVAFNIGNTTLTESDNINNTKRA